MKKYLKNEKGLTLVEVLAVIIIGSIIMLLIFNVHLFSQKQYKSQSEKSRHLYDVTYAAKVITKEIRKAEKVTVKDNMLTLTLNLNEAVFELKSNSIVKDGNPFILEISKFEVDSDGQKITLAIESIVKNGKNESVKTEIYTREGVIIEK